MTKDIRESALALIDLIDKRTKVYADVTERASAVLKEVRSVADADTTYGCMDQDVCYAVYDHLDRILGLLGICELFIDERDLLSHPLSLELDGREWPVNDIYDLTIYVEALHRSGVDLPIRVFGEDKE